MSIAALLSDLRERDIRLSADGERLRCNAPAGALTPDLSALIREHKAQILEFLLETLGRTLIINRGTRDGHRNDR